MGPFSFAQVNTDRREAEPVGGSSKLALRYFKIDFTPAQREKLAGREIELIYTIDARGNAVLEDVNGVEESRILDSISNVTLPGFNPRVINGAAEESIYFFRFSFPAYKADGHVRQYQPKHFRRAYSIDDFEYIHKSGTRMDMLIGGVANGFAGSAARYSGIGGGMKLDLIFSGRSKTGFGMMMVFNGNPNTRDYPIVTARPQNPSRLTMLLGGVINKPLFEKNRREVIVQLEIAYALQNIVTRSTTQDDYYLQANGFSPGASINLSLPIGRERLGYYYAMPHLYSHYVNFHAAIRPVFFNLKQASGLMLEAGISYRLRGDFVDEYLMKD